LSISQQSISSFTLCVNSIQTKEFDGEETALVIPNHAIMRNKSFIG